MILDGFQFRFITNPWQTGKDSLFARHRHNIKAHTAQYFGQRRKPDIGPAVFYARQVGFFYA